MDPLTFRTFLAIAGLIAFLALLGATVYLVSHGQTGWAAFTGSGAVALATSGLYKLLEALGSGN